ncbi:MAG: filamentous hemagglutinin N-terminal domain-containing protein, partial [Gallionellaceae bacterium]
MIKPEHRVCSQWKRTTISVAIACLFATAQAQANGLDPAVVAGQASFSTQGNSLNVSNSPGSIINWQSFSVGANETTHFHQQSAASSVLNRVIGPDPSQILGSLTSNGRVFLINPSGILVGAGARIDVAGLVASTLNLTNQDFLSGKLNFSANPLAGNIQNQGHISTPSGGHVYLVAGNVTNNGIINSPNGDVILAAGQSVNIFDSGTPNVRVEITADNNKVVNLGDIFAQSGQIGIYGAVLNNAGIINANQISRDASGKIMLRAKINITLETDSYISANAGKGGVISLQSDSGTTLVSGVTEAKGITTTGTGGTIQLLGNQVGLLAANLDVTGASGGGSVLIGGDFQGKNSAVHNARATYVSVDSSIKADALDNGNGGKVIVWADTITRFEGNISARGGLQNGNGGFAEVSGKNHLIYTGQVDLLAPSGTTGILLLDPNNLTIQAAAPDVAGNSTGLDLNAAVNTPNILFADYGALNSIITTVQLITQLNTANVTLQANNDITVAAAIDASSNTVGKTLTLQAGHDVIINAALTSSSVGGGTFILNAGNNVTVGAAITASSGSVTLSAGNNGTGPGVAGGTVTFSAVTAANLAIRFNPVNYTATLTEIAALRAKATLTGTYDARAWTFINNSSATAQSKSYNGSTTALLSAPFTLRSAPDGVTAGQQVSLVAGAANFNSAHVASASTVNFTGYTLSSGGDSANYALFAQPSSQSQTITTATLIPTLTNSSVTKTYNATTAAPVGFAPTFSYTGFATGDTDATLTNTGAVYDFSHVATATKVTVSGLALSAITGTGLTTDYALSANSKFVAATITTATLTPTLTNTSVTKTYNATTAAPVGFTPTFSYTGFATGDTDATLSNTGAAYDFSHVATATKVTVSGLALSAITGTNSSLIGDYALDSGSKFVAATITTATLTPTLTNTSVTKTYNATTAAPVGFAPTFSFTGFATGDTDAALSNTGAAYDFSHVATASKVTVSGLALSAITGTGLTTDYALSANSKFVAATITTATLTPTLTNTSVTKAYNATSVAPVGFTPTYSFSGFATGDTGATLTNTGAAYDFSHVATASKVTVSGLALSAITGTGLTTDYALSANSKFVAATITAATLTPTLTNTSVTKTYNATTAAPVGFTPTFSYTGFATGDTDATLS